MGILIKKIFISNYKSIESQLINLQDTNVFFGKNNTGKSNILKSIHLGMTYETIHTEDVFDSKKNPYNISKKVIIDVYIEPEIGGVKVSSFDDDWTLILGNSISVDIDSNQFFAYRTELSYDEKRNGYINNKKNIKNWKDDGTSNCSSSFNSRIFDNIQCTYIDAHRDISLDLKDRRSFWTKLVSRVKIDEIKRKEIQTKLQDINTTIKEESNLLKLIETELKKTVSDERFEIDISPVTKDLETLYKGIDIYYSNDFFNPVPVSNLGSGVRSWAVFSTIKSQLNLAQKVVAPFHSVLLIEEPESHIHPQSQIHLVKIINETQSQKIIATHSPYVLNGFNLNSMIRVYKGDIGTQIATSTLSTTDIESINKILMINKGDLLFSKIIVFVEGFTEQIVMPMYFKRYFNKHPFELGVTFVACDGGCTYRPYLLLSHTYKLNWFLFSDGEKNVLSSIENSLRYVYKDFSFKIANEKRVITLPKTMNYESYLLSEGFKYSINKVIDRYNGNSHNYIKNKYMTSSQQWIEFKKGKSFTSIKEEEERAILLYLKKEKINLARTIAEEIIKSSRIQDLPSRIVKLMSILKKEV